MIGTLQQLAETVRTVYGGATVPLPFRQLATIAEYMGRQGTLDAGLFRSMRTSPARRDSLLSGVDPVEVVLKTTLERAGDPDSMARSRAGLAQMLVGVLAERAFEQIYRETLETDEFRLEDQRSARSETDYRVFNGRGRPVFRINIKFHGAPFRKAWELVELAPENCFALATYKIHQAMERQRREVLPYVFVVVGVPGLSSQVVGEVLPEDCVHMGALALTAKMTGKRGVEDQIVHHLIGENAEPAISERIRSFAGLIREAEWRVISARKADTLLRDLLFDRVFAVRVRGFNRHYRNAEVDMHFSKSQDLTGLHDFLQLLQDSGVQGLASHLERGTI